MDNKKNPINKGLFFLKLTVVALGIIFLVMLAALIRLKVNQGSKMNDNSNNCAVNSLIEISNNIENISDQDGNLLVLTKPDKKGDQELIKLDEKCLDIISKTKFIIRN